MSIEYIIVWLLVGAVAGFLAGLVMKGRGFGVLGNIIVGIIGAVIGGWLFPQLGIGGSGWLYVLLYSFVGAVILLLIIGVIKKA